MQQNRTVLIQEHRLPSIESESLKPKRLAILHGQITRLDHYSARLKLLSNRLSWLRLATFVGGVTLSFTAYFVAGSVAMFVGLLLTIIVFGSLVRQYRRVNQLTHTLHAWAALKRTYIARATLDWPHIPPAVDFNPPANHPFARDLDLIGDNGIHQLLNTAVTHDGAARLYEWLCTLTPASDVIQARQRLVRELIPLRRFRDRLTLSAVIAGPRRLQRESGALLNWLRQPSGSAPIRTVIGLSVLALVNIGLITGLIPVPAPLNSQVLAVTFGLYGLISIWNLRLMTDSFEQVLAVQATLRTLQAVLTFVETYRFSQKTPVPALEALCAPLRREAFKPSAVMRRVTLIASATSLQSSGIVWLALNAAVPWGLFFSFLLARVKKALETALPGWLNVWYELEALSALATFADLNPGYTFPEIGDLPSTPQPPSPAERRGSREADLEVPRLGGEGFRVRAESPIFGGRALGHPLIGDAQRVCNDFMISALGDVGLITGSNMAGKSSFLRTVGVNLCLAYAGGVVVADQMQTPLFRVFTCIKVSDSVTDGVSYFYAEVKRLKALLDALEQPDALPLCFLIDEIFRGTNNRERLIGSRAYLRALVGRSGLGLISTHDLELIALANELPALRNYHFAETISGDQMVFDYQLRVGPSPTTNALKIMKLAGLPVD